MTGRSVDTVVIGGGLAGSAAAISLARRGASVALFERSTYPHDKVCGEFLSPECEDDFNQLGVLPQVRALQPPPLHSAWLTSPGGATWTAHFERPGMGISRRNLDALLADAARAAGARVCEQATVTGVSGTLDTGFEVKVRTSGSEQTWQARAVVGAHGKRSAVDRSLNRAFLRARQPFVGLKAYFDGPPLCDQVHLHAFPGGYCGLALVESGCANVCLLVRQEQFSRAAGSPAEIEAFVGWMARQNPFLKEWLGKARRVSERWLSISQVPFVAKPPVDSDVLMAGDSAGLIAPLAGNGMCMALDAGLMVARFLTDYFDNRLTASELRRAYAHTWQARFAGRMRLGRALQFFLLRPRLLEPGLRFLNHAPALGDLFVTRTRDFRTV